MNTMFLKQQIKDTILNFVLNKTQLFYIVEPANWSVKWDGKYITEELNNNFGIKARVTTSRFGLRNKIVHFGALGTFIKKNRIVNISKTNKVIFTWFHVSDNETRIKFVKELNRKTQIVHTSSEITKQILIAEGLHEHKIVVAPIGVDLDLFKEYSKEKKKKIKKSLNLPSDRIIIGSFQKDGVGWGDGNEPKLIKGPDIFCDVVERLSKKHQIHILLTGPARGYVIKRLIKAGITFTHKYIDNYLDIVDYYNVLDLYIVTSRVEGGPKAIMESMACGVPVITTRVGMAPEVIKNRINGFIVDVEDVDTIEKLAIELFEDASLNQQIINNALIDVRKYSWRKTTKVLYEKIFRKLSLL